MEAEVEGGVDKKGLGISTREEYLRKGELTYSVQGRAETETETETEEEEIWNEMKEEKNHQIFQKLVLETWCFDGDLWCVVVMVGMDM